MLLWYFVVAALADGFIVMYLKSCVFLKEVYAEEHFTHLFCHKNLSSAY